MSYLFIIVRCWHLSPKASYSVLIFTLDRTLDAFLNLYMFPHIISHFCSPMLDLLDGDVLILNFFRLNVPVNRSNKKLDIPFKGQNLLVHDNPCNYFSYLRI